MAEYTPAVLFFYCFGFEKMNILQQCVLFRMHVHPIPGSSSTFNGAFGEDFGGLRRSFFFMLS